MVENIVLAVVLLDNRVLVATLKKEARKKYFGVPAILIGGRMKKGESSLSAAERKVLEKTGIKVAASELIATRIHPLDSTKKMFYVAGTPIVGRSADGSLDESFEEVSYQDMVSAAAKMLTLYTAVYLYIVHHLATHALQIPIREDLYELEWLKQDLNYFGRKIREGEIVSFPTETVYGLGADALNEVAVAKIIKAKNRPADNPLIVHVPSIEKISLVADTITKTEEMLLEFFSPGPLTLLLKKNEKVPAIVTAGSLLVGVRIPNHSFALEFLSAAQRPVAAPSANKSGKPSATHHQHVHDAFGAEVQLVIHAGNTSLGVESTVVMAKNDEEIIIMRQGAISQEELQESFPTYNVHLVDKNDSSVISSPGLRHKHYAPKGTVIVDDFGTADSMIQETKNIIDKALEANRKVALLAFSDRMPLISTKDCSVFDLGNINSPSIAAKRLFDYLLQCDKVEAEIIVVQLSNDNGVGATYNERVLRAAE